MSRQKQVKAWVLAERAHLCSSLEGAEGRFGLFELGALITVAISLTAMNFLGGGELYVWVSRLVAVGVGGCW